MNFDREDYLKQSSPIEKELKILFNNKERITIFDIGACEGEDSIKYSNLFPNSKIYAFEPLPKNVSLINNNINKHNIKNITVVNKALSNSNGLATFFVSDGKPQGANDSDWDYGNKSSSLLEPDKHKESAGFITFDTKIDVETVTLETYCMENNVKGIDFVHMDVQGAELLVLEGAKKLINSVRSIWLEVSNISLYKDQPLKTDIFNFMIKNNFVLMKDAVGQITGDQLYINKIYYPNYRSLFFAYSISIFFKKVFRRTLKYVSGNK